MSPEELRRRRGALGLSQTDFARVLGYTLRGIGKIEAGASPIRPVLDYATRYLLEHPEIARLGTVEPYGG